MSTDSIVKRSTITRTGKGFSKAELKDAGLSIDQALKSGISIDPRRSSKHEENVKTLKTYIEKKASGTNAKVEKARRATSKIEDIEGIGPVYVGKLVEAGIKTTADLLDAGSTPKGRKTLAEKMEISEKLILKWVNMADLFRIKGVGEEYSEFLEVAGVDTVVELSKRVAENLHAKMLEVNETKKLVRRPPTLSEVKQWIEQAKTLSRKIEY
ncbi:MAG: hypothetical protein QG670_97 [Thermoproteota archaeon]|nr:hypothetical protein [Thermoproteota archaeon]